MEGMFPSFILGQLSGMRCSDTSGVFSYMQQEVTVQRWRRFSSVWTGSQLATPVTAPPPNPSTSQPIQSLLAFHLRVPKQLLGTQVAEPMMVQGLSGHR